MVKNNSIASLLGRSPILPIQQHMTGVLECVQQLEAFFEATFAKDWQQAENCYDRIKELENQADSEKKEIRLNLPRSFFMPIPRNDLLAMVTTQDKAANTAKDISGLMLGRQMSFPQQMSEQVTTFVNGSIATVVEAKAVIDELDELLETGFSGKEIDIVEKLVTHLDKLEHDTDGLERNIRAQLRDMEKELHPVDVMFMYKIIELIGNLADCAQKVGDQVYIIVAR